MTKPIFAIKPGQFADMHDLHLAAVITMWKAGLEDQARELRQRGMDTPYWAAMISRPATNWRTQLGAKKLGRG